MNVQSHFLLMVLFAAAIAIVGGTLLRDERRAQVRTGLVIFGTLVGGAIVAGWVLYFFPL